MKRLFFYLLLILLLLSINLQSKDYLDLDRNVRFGLKAGLNMANFHGSDADEANTKAVMGLCAGAFFRARLSPLASFQCELLHTTKGTKARSDFFGQTLEIEYEFSYIEIPALLRLNFQRGSLTGPALYLGASLAFMSKGEGTIRANGESYTTNVEDNIKFTDFSLIVGYSIDFAMMQNIMVIDVRYTYGISRLAKNSDANDLKNSCLTASVGILF